MKLFNTALFCLLLVNPFFAQATTAALSQEIRSNSQVSKGFINWYYHQQDGQLYMEVNRLEQPFLLVTSLPTGVGSNDIGLDRGQLGQTRLVQFERHGPYLILKQLNADYRAKTNNQAELRSVTEAFAQSVLWRGEMVTGDKNLVAINQLVLNDLHGVSSKLKQTKQGNYRLSKDTSMVLPKWVKSFPNNADVDVLLTFTTDKAGNYARQVTPDADHLSLRMRYSFIQLPDDKYQPRKYRPDVGYLADSYLDYAQPIDRSIKQSYLLRHRLQKVHTGSAPSKVIKPITYYLDPGAPEPVRSALLDGARWWSKAFNKAGFIDGFQVKLLPESADPQDIRYNMIQWVHRATRGWSYGSVISDPRTGEIIKGHVTLGSLRVRQDLLIARGLTSGWKDRKAAHEASMKMALARIRQLAAHEVGHTLGLAHNFAASTFNDSSVMDYPHPKIGMKNGEIDIAHAYGVGVGAWDNFAIQYGYGDFGNKQNTQIALAELVKQAQKQGLRNISEADSRAANSGHVYASLWDNGKDAVDELNRLQSIRELVIKGFGKQALLPDQFQGSLSDAFVPMYLLSRYQINAAAKYLGGTQYSYYQSPISSPAKQWHFVSANKQRAALKALLKTIESDELLVPKKLVSQLVPKAGVLTNTRESFPSSLGVIVDPLAMAEVLSRHTLNNILQPKRLDRINQAYWMDEEQLSVAELIDDVMHASFLGQAVEKAQTAIWMRVNAVAVDSLLASLHSKNTTTEVKAILASKLEFAIGRLKHKAKRAGSAQAAHFNWLATSIEKGIDDKQFRLIEKPLPMPPGSPI